MKIIGRGEWGARPPASVITTTWTKRIGVAYHYSDGNKNNSPRDLQRYAMDSLGYSDTHYNFFVNWRGEVFEGRGWLVVAGHAKNQNTPWIGICFIGRNDDVTPAALAALHDFHLEAEARAGKPLLASGHGQLPGQNTSCPGTNIKNWLAAGRPRPASGSAEGDHVFCVKGQVNSNVQLLQIRLNRLGAGIATDSEYGKKTAAALAALVGGNGEAYGPTEVDSLDNLRLEKKLSGLPSQTPLPESVRLHVPAQEIVVPLSVS